MLFPYYANKKLQKKLWSDKYSTRKDMDRWFQKIVIPQSSRTKAINRSVSDYQDKPDEYSNSVYEGGELFLYELWKTMGDKTFFQMLHKYYQTYQFQIVTTDDFLKTVRSYGTDKGGFQPERGGKDSAHAPLRAVRSGAYEIIAR